MKKRIILLLGVLALSLSLSAQTTKADKFLASYESFVNEVLAMPYDAFHGDTMVRVEKQQHRFMRRYRWYYDDRLSIDQLERYNKLRGKYQRKMNALNKRRRRAVTRGWFQGIMERPTEERDTL